MRKRGRIWKKKAKKIKKGEEDEKGEGNEKSEEDEERKRKWYEDRHSFFNVYNIMHLKSTLSFVMTSIGFR